MVIAVLKYIQNVYGLLREQGFDSSNLVIPTMQIKHLQHLP